MHRLLKNYWHWSHLKHEVLKNLLLVHYKPLGVTSPEITTSILWHEAAKKPTVEALLLFLRDWDATVGTGPKPLKGVPSVVCPRYLFSTPGWREGGGTGTNIMLMSKNNRLCNIRIGFFTCKARCDRNISTYDYFITDNVKLILHVICSSCSC